MGKNCPLTHSMSDIKLAEMSDAARTTRDVWHPWEYVIASKVVIWSKVLLIIWASSSSSLFLLWLSHISVWLTAAVMVCFLSSPKCDWDSARRTEGTGEEKGTELDGKQNILCMATPPLLLLLLLPSPTPSPFTASHLHPFPSSFHFCHSLIFLLHEIRFDSKSPQACQMTDNPSQFYH